MDVLEMNQVLLNFAPWDQDHHQTRDLVASA